MVTLQVKAQPFARNVNSQPRPIKFILNYPRDISYRDRLRKLSLLQLEYRRKIQDLVLKYIKLEQIMLITFSVKP